MSRVLLVNMPFSSVEAPALGISLLQGALRRRDIPCDIRYLQLQYAAQIGSDLYTKLVNFRSNLLLGEWLFAHILFGDRLSNPQTYMGLLAAKSRPEIRNYIIPRLAPLRAVSATFLKACLGAVPWERYSLVGFSSTFAQNLASLALAKQVKERYPQAIIVFGGANCEGEMGAELHRQFPFVDYVCCGESDWLFPELVERLGAGRSVEDLPGLVYRWKGETKTNGDHAPPILELDTLPIPDFEDFFTQLEESGLASRLADLHLVMETSRGCWWGAKSQCTFCGLNGETMMYRSKSCERVLEELAHLTERYPSVKNVGIADNILDMRYFRDVIPGLIERRFNVSIGYEVKSNLRREQLRQLKQAGIDSIQPGIESLDSEVLQRMRKGCTAIQNVQTLKWAREFGINVGWNLLAGFPDEDPIAYREMAEMIPSLFHLQPPSRAVDRLRLDRFSPYFHDPAAHGVLNVRPAEAYRYIYPFPEENLARLAYFFDYDYADKRQPETYTQALKQAVEGWHDHWLNHPNEPGTLRSLRSNGRLILYDTRPSTNQEEMVLEGIARIIYEYCDQGRTLPVILHYLKDLREHPPSRDEREVQKLLTSLVEKRVMLHVDDRYLSLAIPMQDRAQEFIEHFIASITP